MQSERRRTMLLGMAATTLAACGGGEGNAPAPKKQAKATVFLYINGSDLESGVRGGVQDRPGGAATDNIHEMLQASGNPDVNILLQTGGTLKAGWETLRRKQLKNQSLIELDPPANPNASMADPQTLIDFVKWGAANFTAEKYVFIFWNHGGGPIGGFGYDQIHDFKGERAMSTRGIQHALEKSIEFTGKKFELVGFDACLMASFEIAAAIRHAARYFVASQELEPGEGWAYTPIYNYMARNPDFDGAGLGRKIVASFMEKHAQNVMVTQSVFDLSKISKVQDALDELFIQLNNTLQSRGLAAWLGIAGVRANSLDFFTSVFLGEHSTDLMDIGSFLASPKLQGLGVSRNTAEKALDALGEALVLKRWGMAMEHVSGLTLYFPSLSIRNPKTIGEYRSRVPVSQSIGSFVNAYTDFATKGGIPQITVNQPEWRETGALVSTLSSDMYENSYAALLDTDGGIISIQNIVGEGNSITLKKPRVWPTIQDNPVAIAAPSWSANGSGSFLMLAFLVWNEELPVVILGEKSDSGGYTADRYYVVEQSSGGGSTHMTAPRVVKISDGMRFRLVRLKYKNGKITAEKVEAVVSPSQQGAFEIEFKELDITPYTIHLGVSDYLGRMSFAGPPA